MRRQEASNHRRRKDKESESNIYSTAHNQTLKQQKQLNDKNHQYLSILTLNVNRVNSPSKDTIWQTGLKRNIQQSVVCR
jgi:hypothetical protein